MSVRPFPTQEIGSLPKFSWRTKPFREQLINDDDIALAKRWGERLAIDSKRKLVKLLSKRLSFTQAEKKRIVEFSLLYALRIEETAGDGYPQGRGLDLVWSGEQARTEMYETPVSSIGGFKFIGRVRSFDNKYWRIASIRKPPSYVANYHLDEFLYTKKHARRRIKVPITDPITLMAWSDNFYYTKKWSEKGLPPSVRSFSARREFTLDLAKIIRRVVRELIQEGAEEFQLDIPAATQYQSIDDVKLVAESFNEITEGLNARFSVHSCFPSRYGYGVLFPYILEMKKCDRFSFEYANRDTYRKGQDGDSRIGYKDLRLFKEHGYNGSLGVGVVHVHTNLLPSVRVVRDRILYAERITDLAPERVFANPDCGLRTRTPEIAYSMLSLLVKGAEEARKERKVP